MKAARLLLITLVLLAVTTSAFAQGQSGARSNNHARATADAQGHADSDLDNMSADVRTKGLDHAENAKLFAKWSYDNATGVATGRFVHLIVKASNASLTEVGIVSNNSTVPLFASITPTGLAAKEAPRVKGAILRFGNDNFSFGAHNNPVGLWTYRVDADTTFTLVSATGATFANDTNRTLRVNTATIHGHVIIGGNGSYQVDNGTATISVPAGGSLSFMGHPSDLGGFTTNAASLHKLKDAIAAKRVGGIANIVAQDGNAVEDREFFGVNIHTKSVGNGSATITLSSDDVDAKAVVLHLDDSVVNATNVHVQLDGQDVENVAAENDALLPADGSAGAKVFVNRTASGLEIVVNVPHFSDRTLTIASVGATTAPPPTITPTTTSTTATTGTPTTSSPAAATSTSKPAPGAGVAIVALAGIAAAVLLLRRRA